MGDAMDLLIVLAEMAGIFVGFGALISVSSRSEIASSQLGLVRAMVTIGLIVIIASLVPVGLARYGIAGHDLWFLSSLVFLVLNWTINILSLRQPENRQLMISQARDNPLRSAFFWLLLEIPMQLPLVLIVLGINTELDEAFYITSIILNLLQAAFVMAQFVYSHPVQTGEEA